MNRFAGKTVLIAGGGQTPGPTTGNGRAMSLLFAREGASVVVVDRDEESALETVRHVTEGGGRAEAIVADATEEEDCVRVASFAKETFGTVDVLVNNVGINAGDTGPTAIDVDLWDRIMRVNTRSVFLMSRAVLPLMRAQESGVIINISSAATTVSLPMFAYKMSKAGVNAATLALADANARFGIRANAILPGLIDTPMGVDALADAYGLTRQEWVDRRNAKVPLRGGMGTAWDVANAAAYLASDDARFVTGVLLTVDGGQSLRVG